MKIQALEEAEELRTNRADMQVLTTKGFKTFLRR